MKSVVLGIKTYFIQKIVNLLLKGNFNRKLKIAVYKNVLKKMRVKLWNVCRKNKNAMNLLKWFLNMTNTIGP